MLKQEKSNQVFISIAIPTWNRYKEVVRAIESINISNYNDLEIIVCDNNSDDNISNELEKYCSNFKSIKFFKNDSNIGMTPNWNKALSLCSGEWISLLCSDDCFVHDGFKKAYDLLKNIKKPCLIIQNPTIKGNTYLEAGVDTAKKINLPIASGNFFHRDILKNCGLFDERLKYSPDGEYWIRIATKYDILMYAGSFAQYNSHEYNYMWETWLKDDILEQMQLIDKITSEYRGENFIEDLEQRMWGTYIFFLNSSIGKIEQQKIVDKYLPIVRVMAYNNKRKFEIFKLFILYIYRKFFPIKLKRIIRNVFYA